MGPTTVEELARAVERLGGAKQAWVRLDPAARIDYLKRCIAGVVEHAESWVAEACAHRGIDPGSPLAGEEWLSGPMTTVRGMRLFVRALEHGGQPPPPGMRPGPDGRTIVDVFPGTLVDRLLYSKIRAEVWTLPGKPATQGRIYREKNEGGGGVALVLGAGNISSIAPLDVLTKLLVDDEVAVLKMNPVNAYLGPVFERAFAPLIDDGYLAVAYGGKEVGAALCAMDEIDSVHLTGSDRTHDAIVWGEDAEERSRRKASNDPLLSKPVTAELGCVTPVLAVPGDWNDADLEFQARHVASMVVHNASHNCNAAKVLVLHRQWGLRDAFVKHVQAALAAVPTRRAYYPGSLERYREFLEHYPRSIKLAPERPDSVPWTLIPDVAARPGEYALQSEAFCGVLAVVDLDAKDAADFLDRAVDFVNESVWGTLSCVMLVDAATQRAHAGAVERAVAGLRYGNVCINAWAGVSFALGVTTWGAYPGHTPESIGSGVGVVHNAYLLDHPEKSVLRAPFRIRPKPVWFADHRRLAELGRQMTRFEADGSMLALAGAAWAGLRG